MATLEQPGPKNAFAPRALCRASELHPSRHISARQRRFCPPQRPRVASECLLADENPLDGSDWSGLCGGLANLGVVQISGCYSNLGNISTAYQQALKYENQTMGVRGALGELDALYSVCGGGSSSEVSCGYIGTELTRLAGSPLFFGGDIGNEAATEVGAEISIAAQKKTPIGGTDNNLTFGDFGAAAAAAANVPGIGRTKEAKYDENEVATEGEQLASDEKALTEEQIVATARNIYNSSDFAQLVAAHDSGESSAEVNIDGYTIVYDSDVPASGMSLFGENGFVIGSEAWSSPAELAKTVLHELYRLGTTQSAGGLYGSLASSETDAAADFADANYAALIGEDGDE